MAGTTTQLDRQTVIACLDELELDEDVIYDGYSGRSMYGSTCFGLAIATGEACAFFVRLALATEDNGELAEELARSMRTEQLGHGTIVFFPGYELTSPDEDEYSRTAGPCPSYTPDELAEAS